MSATKNSSLFRPTILQKGLGLIIFPLLLQVIFFWQFFALIDKLEALNRAEIKQAYLVECMNKLNETFTVAWGTLLTETLESNKIRSIDAATYKARTEEGLARLKQYAPSSAFNGLVQNIEGMAAKQYDLLNEFSDTEPGESSIAIYAKYRKLKLALRPVMKKAAAISAALTEEREKLNASQLLGRQYRDSFKVQLMIGVALDTILTMVLVAFLLRNITNRLDLLVRNARMLPEGEPLLAQVSGSDELAYLDEVLYQASSDLAKAADYRKQMMETMSHDLRSPIQSALITAEILESLPATQGSEKTLRQIEGLKRNLGRVVKLVEDNLTIDKLESGTAELEISRFDISETVDEAIDSVLAQAQRKSLELQNKVASVMVEADRERILQVLANFLTNAVKYSPASAPIIVSSQNLGHSVKIMILDDGPGIEPNSQASVFERFKQVADDGKARQGYGLGLAICKMLISHHGGTVGLTSEPGKGSTFWFILPLRYES